MNKQPCLDSARAQTVRSESARIQALESYEILDTPLESLFDDIARLAADVCETPIAVVNFVASERQWFKAEVGIGTRELPLDVSICRHAILQPGLFVVPDLTKDSRFENNPLVEAAGGLRFYAGALIETAEGLPLGTVCVLDTKPRTEGLAERQGRLLKTLARQVMSELELRRALKQRDAEVAAARRSETTLRQSEVRLQMAQRAARAVSWEWDFAAGEIRWGDLHTARELAGDDLTETTLFDQWMAKVHPEDVEQQLAESAAAVEAGGGNVSFRIIREGEVRWLEAMGQVTLTDDDGRPLIMTGITHDITERKLVEERLRDLNETLEARIAAAMAEREQAEEALRQAQKMEAVGQLTGGIAHDFNNLLTIVTGNIEMASRALDAAGVADARARRALGNASKGAERAAALTQRLLAFSRRQPLAPKPIDVDKLVLGMSDLLNRSLGETVKLEIVTSPNLWRTEADPNQLESAILNLAVNARDSMPRGGTLSIESANARLDEEYAAAHAEVAPGQYVMIAVTDTGAGMSKDVAARVFEPFFTTKDVGKGTGLGLSQVYGFVKQSGGHVNIYSEEGHGTTVKLYLPRLLIEAAADDRSDAGSGLELSRSAETILVVEDDDDVRAYTVECLRELGYEVLEAHDGPSALRLLEREEEPVDLLFTDVVMPRMSGRELADAARLWQPGLKVLYTSGYTRNAIINGGRLEPGVQMIPKPFSFAALAQKVRDSLERGRSGRVLVVEDEATLRMFASETLAEAGYSVDEAANAFEALMRVRSRDGRYDAVVIDIALPDKRGDALAIELRAMHKDLPLLLVTGEQLDDVKEQFAGDACAAVLAKPFGASGLREALAAVGISCAEAAVDVAD